MALLVARKASDQKRMQRSQNIKKNFVNRLTTRGTKCIKCVPLGQRYLSVAVRSHAPMLTRSQFTRRGAENSYNRHRLPGGTGSLGNLDILDYMVPPRRECLVPQTARRRCLP